MGKPKDADYHKKYHEAMKKERVCVVCGNKFMAVKESQTCKPKCRGQLKSRRNRTTFTCSECGKEFTRTKANIKAGRDKTCSVKCQRKRHSKYMMGENHPMWKDAMIGFECVVCGEKFKRYKKDETRNKTCSVECRYIYIARALSGENHYLWVGGHNAYRGAGWQKVRDSILIRDKYACQECGKTAEEEWMDLNRDLSVHHIIPFRFFGDDHEKANQPENLVTLCATCHAGQDCHRWKEVEEFCLR